MPQAILEVEHVIKENYHIMVYEVAVMLDICHCSENCINHDVL
jgi:hypothetical protein